MVQKLKSCGLAIVIEQHSKIPIVPESRSTIDFILMPGKNWRSSIILCARTPARTGRCYPDAWNRVFHHSLPIIPGSARDGKPENRVHFSYAFGYLGDVGDYPGTLSDLISPSPVPRGWNG